MALNLIYPLKRGTYHRVRGFKDHKIGWKGIDDGCKVGTPLIASESGRISHSYAQTTGGGWNFRLNFTKYKGWFMWYAHNSVIPTNGKIVKRGQVIGKSGATGGVYGPHLHFSLIQGSTPKDPDNPSVVQWVVEDKMADAKTIYRNIFITIFKRWPNQYELKSFVDSKTAPYTYAQKHLIPKRYASLTAYNKLKTTVSQQKSQIKTLSGQMKNLQGEIQETIDKSEAEISELSGKIDTLNKKLKACQKPPKPSVKPIQEDIGWFNKLINWLRR